MASKVETNKNRAPLVLVILVVAQLLLMSYHARAHGSQHSMLRGWVLTAAYPFQVGFGSVSSFIYNYWHNYINLTGAREENKQLHTENEQMRQELFHLREEVA